MLKTIKNIGLIFVVSLLILATGGFSVYRHVCHCAGEMSASVFLEAECHHDQQTSDCSNSEITASCCQKEAVPVKKHTCHNDNCCQSSVQFFKISDSFQSGLE